MVQTPCVDDRFSPEYVNSTRELAMDGQRAGTISYKVELSLSQMNGTIVSYINQATHYRHQCFAFWDNILFLEIPGCASNKEQSLRAGQNLTSIHWTQV